MSYSFDTQLLSAAELGQDPPVLTGSLSSQWLTGVADPTVLNDVGVISFAPDTVALLFNKVTVTQATSALSLATAPDGNDASDTQATATLSLTANPYLGTGFTINGESWILSAGFQTQATGVLTLSANPASGNTFTISVSTWTLSAEAAQVDGYVLLGDSRDTTLSNMVSAVNGTDGYTTGIPTVVTATSASGAMNITAVTGGLGGNIIVTTETLSSGGWGAATLTGAIGDPPDTFILMQADVEDTIKNAVSAINGTDAWNTGSTYVTAVSAPLAITITAIEKGTVGNSYTLTETMSSGAWSGTTMSGGVEGGGTIFQAAQAYHGSTFATMSANGQFSIFTYTSATSSQPTPSYTDQVSSPEQRRKWLLGYK